jgi:hypothetical protein
MVNRVRRTHYVPQGTGETAGFTVDSRGSNLVADFGPGDRRTVGAEGIDTVLNIRTRFTVAQINAGASLLPARPGYKYRLVDAAMIAVGGNAATATSVDLLATQGAASVKLVANAVAGLTRSTLLRAGATNSTILADGASFVANDVNTALTVGKTGGSLATATHVDVIATVVIEKA